MRTRLFIPSLVSLLTLSWMACVLLQGALAWGFRGEDKPTWFVVLSVCVWTGAPWWMLVVGGAFYARRKLREDAGKPT